MTAQKEIAVTVQRGANDDGDRGNVNRKKGVLGEGESVR
jgi:hypothetical protein